MGVSFEKDIKPYFSDLDREHMNSEDYYAHPFDLWSAAAVKERFDGIRSSIKSGHMPPGPDDGGDGPWPPEKIAAFLKIFDEWKGEGYQS